jgi:hypothetical protein
MRTGKSKKQQSNSTATTTKPDPKAPGEKMDEQTYMDFIMALGEEYNEVMDPLAEYGAVPQDGFEVFAKMYGAKGISPNKLHAATKKDIERLRDIARAYHESGQIEAKHLRIVIRRILARWPASK